MVNRRDPFSARSGNGESASFFVMATLIVGGVALAIGAGCNHGTNEVRGTSGSQDPVGSPVGAADSGPRERRTTIFTIKPEFTDTDFDRSLLLRERLDELSPENRKYLGRLPEPVVLLKSLHDEMSDEVRQALVESGLRNYSLHVTRHGINEYYAVRYYEYVGDNHPLDTIKLTRNAAFCEWRDGCEACLVTIVEGTGDPWWNSMEEIYHDDLHPSPDVKVQEE